MAVDERRRHEMYLAFEELVGAEVATTMMEHLPPVGWGDVATKRDIEGLALATKRDTEVLGAALRAEFHAEMTRQIRWLVPTMFTMVLGTVGGVLAAVRLG